MFDKTRGFIAWCSCTLLCVGTLAWGKPPGVRSDSRSLQYEADASAGGVRGDSGLHSVGLGEGQCPASLAPEIEIVSIGGSQPGAVLVEMTKIRNLAFSIPESGERAVQVTFDDLPVPFDVANGTAMWVAEPSEECENSGQMFGTPIDQCGPTGGLPSKIYKVARLQCAPLYRDWSGDGAFSVYDELIVPKGTYSIRVVHITCPPSVPEAFSDPLTITTSIWGDLVKDCTASEPSCYPPDNSVDVVTDVVAALCKFCNTTAISKSRVDIEPALLDGQVNISDVTFVLEAFAGDPYPFSSVPELCSGTAKSGSDE